MSNTAGRPDVPGHDPGDAEVTGADTPSTGAAQAAEAAGGLDELPARELAEVPSVEVISRAAVMLMSATAERLGLSAQVPAESEHRDLDEARRLITALAGLVTSSAEYLGLHAGPLRDGLQSLQRAFREESPVPDEPGSGPGERYTGPVY